MSNFDLSDLALKAVCPDNEILYDDKGLPSIMVKIPKKTYAELGLGNSTATFPAFLVNGEEKDYIWISKYQNIVQNGRAYSLPGQDPKTNINFDNALAACSAKGSGWHLMTAMEWGALILWCEQNGYIPIGNNYFGKHSSESVYKALPMNWDSSNRINRIATGTGPLEWYHDKSLSGIADLCGNVWEWTGGIRTVYGELQVLANNNAADTDNPQTAASTIWMAINASDGSLITPNGSGTTSGSVKMDYASSKLTYDTAISASQGGAGVDTEFNCQFKDIAFSANIGDDAKNLLIALGMAPKTGTIIPTNNICYWRPFQAERSFFRGGYYSNSAYGFASFYGSLPRSYADGVIGFRSAFVEL